MRTITVTRRSDGVVQFAFDAETARATSMAGFTMSEPAAAMMATQVLSRHAGPPMPFIGIVHDGGEVQITISGGT